MADSPTMTTVQRILFLRRSLSLQPDAYVFAAVLGLATWAEIRFPHVHDQLPSLIGLYVLLVGLEVAMQLRVYIAVTRDQVIVGRFRQRPAMASRSNTYEIHMYSIGIRLTDAGANTVLSGSRYWRKAQILRLAKSLDVPFYDHRKWWCMADRDEGRLVYRPNYVTP